MKIKFSLLLALSGILTVLHAGSILSSGGIGLPMGLSNARSMGMAGTAIALADPYDIPRINPAGLGYIDLSRFTIQYVYESNKSEDGLNSARTPYSNFDGFMFAIPVAGRAGISLGLIPYSRMDFKTGIPGQVNTEPFDQVITGSGGINALNLSGAFRVKNRLSLGITGRFYFGKIEHDWMIDFPESDLFTTKNTYATRIYGTGLLAGVQYRFDKVMLGAVFTPEIRLDTRTTRDYKSMDDATSLTYLHLRDTLEGSITLPASFGFGAGWQASKNIRVGLDAATTLWNDMKINREPAPRSRNTTRWSAGLEYISTSNPYASIWSRSAYRTGFSYEPFYLTDARSNVIHQWWISLGMGLPVWNNTSRANIAFAYGRRGDLESNGLSENLYRIVLSLDAGEKWFERRAR
ncbi:hypothetical protein JW948_11465 [bacterium]|nr:hypothetical protein [bacterium]